MDKSYTRPKENKKKIRIIQHLSMVVENSLFDYKDVS